MKQTLCLYHANCLDGVMAAWVVGTMVGFDQVEFVPLSYYDVKEKMPAHLTYNDRDVIIVDFSISVEVMLNSGMLEQARNVHVIDHHDTAHKQLDGVDLGDNFEFTYSKEASGAKLVWQKFMPNTKVPQVIEHVSDRDLWNFKLAGSNEVFHFLTGQNWMRLQSWEAITEFVWDFEGDTGRVPDGETEIAEEEERDEFRAWTIARGKIIMEAMEEQIHFLLANNTSIEEIAGYRVPVANLPYSMASRGAEILYENYPFAVIYSDERQTGYRRFSFRSKKGEGLNVRVIAEGFGGGGHDHAAGFQTPLSDLEIHGAWPEWPSAARGMAVGVIDNDWRRHLLANSPKAWPLAKDL